MAPKRPVSFAATQIVKKPTTVAFKRENGEVVIFKATKAVEERVTVKFVAKRKK